MNRKTLLVTIGFALFILGGSEIVLSLVGVRLAFLAFLDAFGAGVGFVLKLIMMIGGIVLAAIGSINSNDNEEKDQYLTRNDNY